jgi:DNA repair protein RecN (Recombination protein N)
MLHELRIRDIAIIEDVTVCFGPGLNVLSGETGAGKSIILGALGLVLGGRGSADIVRTGRADAEVQGFFDRTPEVDAILAELELPLSDDDAGFSVRRLVSSAGRSRAWIGGTSVPIASLRRLASTLVDYASQHEHQVLLDMQQHRGILDRFGGLQATLVEVHSLVGAAREFQRELDRLRGLEEEQRARMDYLRFQLNELDDAEPVEGEEAALENERRVLGDAVRLAERARVAEQALYGGNGAAVERLGAAVRALRELTATDVSLADTLESMEQALICVEDAGRELGTYSARTRANPRRLQEAEDRLAQLRQLARKHRTDPEGLVALHARIRTDLEELEGLDVRLDGLEADLAQAATRARTACADLTRRRGEAAGRLSSLVEVELASLAMPHARLVVDVAPLAAGDGLNIGAGIHAAEHGADAVEMLLSANLGEVPRALNRVASGGELSRILLAVRRALAGTSSVQVQVAVFDEIDSGMGGATAESVAAKLVDISAEGQVLAITHLPRIAGAADHHFRVEKVVEGGRTRTDVHLLDGQERVEELVRMVAGTSTTEAAATFARELLDWRTGESPP